MSKILPVSPNEADAGDIPDFVIAVVNGLLKEGKRQFSVDLVIERVVSNTGHVTKQQMFDKGWLNFEKIYREAGWLVRFDSPDWGESSSGHYSFTKK